MSENRNKFETDEAELRVADSVKSDESKQSLGKKSGYDFLQKEKRMKEKDRGAVSMERTAKRKMPLALDIIISVMAVALVAALVVGAVFAFKYFSVEYDEISIEYTVLVWCADDANSITHYCKKGADVYSDVDGKTVFLGKVVSVKPAAYEFSKYMDALDKTEYYALTVEIDSKYRDGEGYFTDDFKLAVGKSLDIRVGELEKSGVCIVEIDDAKHPIGEQSAKKSK